MARDVQGLVKVIFQGEADLLLLLFAEVLWEGGGLILVVPLVNALELLKIPHLFLLSFPLPVSPVVSSYDYDHGDEDGRKENGDDHNNDADNDVFVVGVVIGKWLHGHIGVCEHHLQNTGRTQRGLPLIRNRNIQPENRVLSDNKSIVIEKLSRVRIQLKSLMSISTEDLEAKVTVPARVCIISLNSRDERTNLG